MVFFTPIKILLVFLLYFYKVSIFFFFTIKINKPKKNYWFKLDTKLNIGNRASLFLADVSIEV